MLIHQIELHHILLIDIDKHLFLLLCMKNLLYFHF
nr:MAG TPA: hypothetical protein [Caudoviricetes sp.]